MTSNPVTVTVDTSIKVARRTMLDRRCRRMPVVDRFGKPTGALSLDDILVVVADELQMVAEVVAAGSL